MLWLMYVIELYVFMYLYLCGELYVFCEEDFTCLLLYFKVYNTI